MKVILISCVSQKLTCPATAQELYISDWFKKAVAYAKATGCDWYILSAAHGLLHPEQITLPYDATLKTMPQTERADWAHRVAYQLRGVLPPGTQIEILAGRAYREQLIPRLHEYDVTVPLEGLGIGSQKRRLMDMTAELLLAPVAASTSDPEFKRLVWGVIFWFLLMLVGAFVLSTFGDVDTAPLVAFSCVAAVIFCAFLLFGRRR